MAKRSEVFFWSVGCAGHVDVWVEAPNWEQATVKAAGAWKAPWREVAARCELKEKKRVLRGVCPKCGRFFYGGAELCDRCLKAQEDDERNLQQYLKNRYRHTKRAERGISG